MQAPVDWLKDRIPHRIDEDEVEVLRWTEPEWGNPQEAPVQFVADRYGPQIEQTQQTSEDVLNLVLASGPDDGWHDIWRRWRELGYI